MHSEDIEAKHCYSEDIESKHCYSEDISRRTKDMIHTSDDTSVDLNHNIIRDDGEHKIRVIKHKVRLSSDSIELDKIFGFIMGIVIMCFLISIVIVVGLNADKIFNPPVKPCNLVTR